MYRRFAIQLSPLGPVYVPVRRGSPVGQRALALLLALVVAASLGVVSVRDWRARSLERELAAERARATLIQRALSDDAQSAGQRSAALEQDLRAVEDETARLYDVVRSMRTLGEQLRERVGLPAPIIEPLPELPPRMSPRETTPSAAADGPLVLASLPVDTGPWPVEYGAQPLRPVSSERVHAAGDAIARQWEQWQQLSQAVDSALTQRTLAARPSIRPAYGVVTSWFGRRPGFWGILAIHTGIDISLPMGTPVVSTANGVVSFAGVRSGFGNTVEIAHEGGLLTLYGHLSRPLVTSGTRVSQGQIVALSGNSGISTGPHLHYEVRLNGVPVDPSRYW